jgi:cytochrome P450 family 6
MGSFFVTIAIDALIVIAALLVGVYVYYQRRYKYWDKKKIPHTRPSFPMGDFSGSGRTKSLSQVVNDIYWKYQNESFVGAWMMSQPLLLARDTEFIKRIFIKDFQNFHDRGINFNEEIDPLEGKGFKYCNNKS